VEVSDLLVDVAEDRADAGEPVQVGAAFRPGLVRRGPVIHHPRNVHPDFLKFVCAHVRTHV